MIRFLADLSRFLNRMSGGEAGKTLCWRVARRWGVRCLFCVVIGAVLREHDHCQSELDG